MTACENYTFRPLAHEYAGRISFYAVAAGAYDLAKPTALLQKEIDTHDLPYTVYVDRDHKTVQALSAQVTPETYLIGPGPVLNLYPDATHRRVVRWTAPATETITINGTFLGLVTDGGTQGSSTDAAIVLTDSGNTTNLMADTQRCYRNF